MARRYWLLRGGGVPVLARRAGQAWRFGLGRYRGNEFAWYALRGLRLSPQVVLPRSGLTIAERRPLDSAGRSDGRPAETVLRFAPGARGDAHGVEFVMAEDVLTGFQSWLEAEPPGSVPGSGSTLGQ